MESGSWDQLDVLNRPFKTYLTDFTDLHRCLKFISVKIHTIFENHRSSFSNFPPNLKFAFAL